jgi:two-component system, OmpR family, phosphate regulon response regulator OmpR
MDNVSERVLLIEDDSRLAGMVVEYLGKAGYRVIHEENGTRGLALHEREPVDVVILDLMLPDTDGLDICRRLRARSDGPILMLTARGDPMDRVIGLEMGADDYLPKPFEPRELLARLRAILRRSRSRGGANEGQASDVLRYGRLEIDRGAREVRLDGAPCALTGYQFALLLALAEHAGRVMSRDALMDAVKGEQLEAFDRSIDVHVSRIRAVIEDDPRKPRRIITVRGIGYVFAKAQD